MIAQGALSQADWDQKRSAAETAEANLLGDSAAVETARLNLEYASIRAPISGRTGRLMAHEGDYVKAAAIVKKPLMAVVGNANFPATAEAMKAARVAVGQSATMMSIALGAVDKALTELSATGRMTEAQKGALGRETSDKVEQVEELNARARKYNLPRGSATER